MWVEGYHGNEADLNCDCTILIKDHDGTEEGNLPVYLQKLSNSSSVSNTIRRNNARKRSQIFLNIVHSLNITIYSVADQCIEES